MSQRLNILIKILIIIKVVFIVIILPSVIMIASELWGVRNQVEGRELVKEQPEKLTFLIIIFFTLITTLLFDLRALKQKKTKIYKNWTIMLLLTIVVIVINSLLKIQWLEISLTLLLSFYAIYLLFKFPTNT